MKFNRMLGVAALAAATLVPASMASADTTTIDNVGNNGFTWGVQSVTIESNRADPLVIGQIARAHNLGDPTGSSRNNMLLECASNQGGARGVIVYKCFIRGKTDGAVYSVSSPGGAKPGTSDAAAGVFPGVVSQVYEACVQTRALLASGDFYETPVVCSVT